MINIDRRRAAIRRHAIQIHRGERPQDVRILCPVHAGGAFCQWVAGHYGACALGRFHDQSSFR